MAAPALKTRQRTDPIDPELFDDVSRWWAAESRFDAIVKRTDCRENPLRDTERSMVLSRLERVSAIFGHQVASELRTALDNPVVETAPYNNAASEADPTDSGNSGSASELSDGDVASPEGLAGVRALPTTPFAPSEPRLTVWGAVLRKVKIRR